MAAYAIQQQNKAILRGERVAQPPSDNIAAVDINDSEE